MEVRKWNSEIFGAEQSELRLVHVPTSLTHFYVPKNLHITFLLVTRFVPRNHANHLGHRGINGRHCCRTLLAGAKNKLKNNCQIPKTKELDSACT